MNMLLFFPAGILSRFLFPKNYSPRRKFAVMIAVYFCFSLSIETI